MGPGVGGGRPEVGLHPDAPPPQRDPMLALRTHVGRAGARVHAGVPGEGGDPGATNVPVAGRAGVRGGACMMAFDGRVLGSIYIYIYIYINRRCFSTSGSFKRTYASG